MRVLVTVGSMAEKKFTRLFQAVDELCRQGVLQGEMVTAQVGFDGYRSRYYQCFDMVSREAFEEMIRRSDLIITHGRYRHGGYLPEKPKEGVCFSSYGAV